jgi:hypothetical protein
MWIRIQHFISIQIRIQEAKVTKSWIFIFYTWKNTYYKVPVAEKHTGTTYGGTKCFLKSRKPGIQYWLILINFHVPRSSSAFPRIRNRIQGSQINVDPCWSGSGSKTSSSVAGSIFRWNILPAFIKSYNWCLKIVDNEKQGGSTKCRLLSSGSDRGDRHSCTFWKCSFRVKAVFPFPVSTVLAK